MTESFFDKQAELEEESEVQGGHRFNQRVEDAKRTGRSATVGAALRLAREAINPLTEAIDAMCTEKRRGPRNMAQNWCEQVGSVTAAHFTVMCVLNNIYEGRKLAEASREISMMILDELRFRRFEEQAKGLWEYKIKTFRGTDHYGHKRRSLNHTMAYAEIDVSDLDMSTVERVQVGTKLISLLMESTDLVERKTNRRFAGRTTGRGIRTDVMIQATEDTLAWLGGQHEVMQWFWPVYYPMVVPPLPWSKTQAGGYRFTLRGRHRLVRDRWGQTDSTHIMQADMPEVYQALNTVQATGWTINGDVLDLLQYVEVRQLSPGMRQKFLGVPALSPLPSVPKSEDMEEDSEELRLWKRAESARKGEEAERISDAITYKQTMGVANKMEEYDTFYFPWNLDFRGRMYPIPVYLQPQGDDLNRALLTFAEAKLIGGTGGVALALHGTSCMGEFGGAKFSQMSLDERHGWVTEHTDRILQVASDPWEDQWWTEAEKPLQFYAFCIEWAGYAASGYSAWYECNLPVGVDGSCNGLQHFSALLRDEDGGAAVNMAPADYPEDFYGRVADKVVELLTEGHYPDDRQETADMWLKAGSVIKIDRKLVKRPTMTFSYGSKRYGFTRQIMDELRSRNNWREIKAHFVIDEVSKIKWAAEFLADLILAALHELIVAAFDGMDWMQAAAKLVAAENNIVKWEVPITGFPVHQAYYKFSMKQIETKLAGKICQPAVYIPTDEVRSQKQANSVAPNFIHSLDAAALMLTVNAGAWEGISSFSMIHDSYATHAGDSELLAKVLRSQFVRLHSEDIVASLRNSFKSGVTDPDTIPEPPVSGSLHLEGVEESRYFFA